MENLDERVKTNEWGGNSFLDELFFFSYFSLPLKYNFQKVNLLN